MNSLHRSHENHGCYHARAREISWVQTRTEEEQRRARSSPDRYQVRVGHPKDGAAEKERGSSLNTPPSTLPPQRSPAPIFVLPARHGRKKGNASDENRAHMLRLSSDTHAPSSSALGCLTLAFLSRFLLCILVVSFLLRHHLRAPSMRGQSVRGQSASIPSLQFQIRQHETAGEDVWTKYEIIFEYYDLKSGKTHIVKSKSEYDSSSPEKATGDETGRDEAKSSAATKPEE